MLIAKITEAIFSTQSRAPRHSKMHILQGKLWHFKGLGHGWKKWSLLF
jgi:hypothetical protein